jgi:hypothetical protein
MMMQIKLKIPCTRDGVRHAQVLLYVAVLYVIPAAIRPPGGEKSESLTYRHIKVIIEKTYQHNRNH